MTCTKKYKEHIEYTFHAFCRVVIRNAMYTAVQTRNRKYKREISLDYLTDEKHYPFGTTDKHFKAPEPDGEEKLKKTVFTGLSLTILPKSTMNNPYFILRGGDNIGRIIILELTDRDSSAFEDILSFLSRHPDIKKWELRDEPILSLPGLQINLARRKITSNGREISLTAKEYDIFCLLVANKNRVLTYDQIYEKVWGDFSSGSERETIGFHVRNLRKKLFDTAQEPAYQIESIRDVGYRFQYN